MSRIITRALFFLLLSAPALALAGTTPSPADPPVQVAALEERLAALERERIELYHTLAEKKEAGLASQITERITVSGLIEVEGSAERLESVGGDADSASDLILATAQLGFGVKVTEHLTGDLIFLFEEDATDLEVDEAAVNFANEVLFGRFGRQYLPFGVFHSHFISDPLTLELGETRETALLGGYTHDLFALSAFVFNGDAEKDGQEDHIRDWGASLTVTPLEGLELGGSYLADLADTDAGLLADRNDVYRKRVGGWSAFAVFEQGKLGLAGEVLGATEAFAAADLDADGDGQGDRPLAWNLEASWDLRENLELAARLEGSDEFAGQPELQYGLDASWGVHEYVTLSLEYLRGEFDEGFGDGIDRRDLITAQLAFEF